MLVDLKGLHILVTGGAGFLGQHLIRRLLEKGANIDATSRTPPSGGDKVCWHAGTYEHAGEIDKLLAKVKPDVIYHFAGAVSGSPNLSNLIPTFQSLLASSVHFLHHACENGPRLVLAGSFLEPRLDGMSTIVGSPYAAAKQATRIYGDLCVSLYNAPVVQTVPFMVYGPGQPPGKLIPYVINSMLEGKAPELSDGSIQADWVYVGDVADALVACAIEPQCLGKHIDLGTGLVTSISEVVDRIAKQINGPLPRYGSIPNRPYVPPRKADVHTAQEILKWKATTSLDEGLQQTIAFLRN
jgi:nucleoside-diphosphate-sugar epimerase